MPFGKAVAWHAPRVVTVNFGTNAAILTSPNVTAFIADADYEVESVSEVHETAGSDGGAVTLDVVKCTGTQAASGGTSMLAATFNLKGTANTVVRKDQSTGTLASSTGRVKQQITKGDRVALNFSGTLTSLTGVCVTIILRPRKTRPVW